MSEKINISTIAFEGLHRSGKGTQIEILKNKLEELKIPCIVIRGAGSRPNQDGDIGDVYSDWWKTHLEKLRSDKSTKEDWIDGSRRLAREMLVFRDYILPKYAKEHESDRAILIIDRTILSHLAIFDQKDIDSLDKELFYGNRDSNNRKLPSTRDVFPDIVFYLKADSEVLLSRLDINDPKYEFRKRNIMNNESSFDRAISSLPDDLRRDIIEIDASKSSEEISVEIQKILALNININNNKND